MQTKYKIAVLDDYQNVAAQYADWAMLEDKGDVTFFHDHLADEELVIQRLKPFAVICVMRERTPLNRSTLSQLSELKLIVSTGSRNASIDGKAAEDLGILLKHTGYLETGAPEMTWALLMSLARHIPQEYEQVRNGKWQSTVGTDLAGKTIGIIGLGRIGSKIASYAKTFDMRVLAWSTNLTDEKAQKAGATLVDKETLFKESDFITIHLVLSERTRGIIGTGCLSLMKPTAFLINTARGPLVEETALINILQNNQIAGAALDVFAAEPLPGSHPLRHMNNVLATPHIGYVTENTYRLFYGDTVNILKEWLA